MSDLKTLHREAMDLAEQAEIAKLRGEGDVVGLFGRAFEFERRAAAMLASQLDAEPTRSVLYRSAASLALTCGEFRQAEQLVATALSGEPPEEIAEELRNLLDQIHFQRHLDLRGWSLEREEIQFSMAGNAVGYGVASSEQFIERIQNFEKLIYRTAERQSGVKYREKGQPSKDIRESVGVLVSVPRAASFAVSLQVGLMKDQPTFDLGVLDELLTCLELFETNQDEQLQRRIPDTAYYTNFFGLARQIAPDGNDVNLVGLTALRGGEQRKLALTRTRDTVSLSPTALPEQNEEQRVRVVGTLRYADDTKQSTRQIRLVSSDGEKHLIIVPEGMMDDIVRPLWGDEVEVRGVKRGKKIHLEDIFRLE